MAYYLTIKDKKGYKSIDISEHINFEIMTEQGRKYSKDKYSLDEIDRFTSNYANIISLKEDLLYNGILSEEDLFKEISIRKKQKDELEKVKYGLVYSDVIKYFDVSCLITVINEISMDSHFLNRLLAYYRSSYCNNETNEVINAVKNGNCTECSIDKLINFMYPYRGITPIADEIYELSLGHFDENKIIRSLLIIFVYNEVYNRNYVHGDFDRNIRRYTGYYEFSKIKYKPLHDLVMFVYNYSHKEELTKEEINEELNEFFKHCKSLKREEEPKKRTLKKNSGSLEGQMSFSLVND